jgi:hypothetical protein
MCFTRTRCRETKAVSALEKKAEAPKHRNKSTKYNTSALSTAVPSPIHLVQGEFSNFIISSTTYPVKILFALEAVVVKSPLLSVSIALFSTPAPQRNKPIARKRGICYIEKNEAPGYRDLLR